MYVCTENKPPSHPKFARLTARADDTEESGRSIPERRDQDAASQGDAVTFSAVALQGSLSAIYIALDGHVVLGTRNSYSGVAADGGPKQRPTQIAFSSAVSFWCRCFPPFPGPGAGDRVLRGRSSPSVLVPFIGSSNWVYSTYLSYRDSPPASPVPRIIGRPGRRSSVSRAVVSSDVLTAWLSSRKRGKITLTPLALDTAQHSLAGTFVVMG